MERYKMKNLFIVLLVLFFSTQLLFSSDELKEKSTSLSLTRIFFEKLKSNTPFKYEDEKLFFGEKTLYSYVILNKLGYLNNKGQWIKQKPKYSFICELIRMYRDKFMLQNPTFENIIEGNNFLLLQNRRIVKDSFYKYVVFVQKIKSKKLFKPAKLSVIVLQYRIPQKKLDIPLYVNGDFFPYIIGFREDSRNAELLSPKPDISKKILDKLVKHINSLP
jgi:hypothetical protein